MARKRIRVDAKPMKEKSGDKRYFATNRQSILNGPCARNLSHERKLESTAVATAPGEFNSSVLSLCVIEMTKRRARWRGPGDTSFISWCYLSMSPGPLTELSRHPAVNIINFRTLAHTPPPSATPYIYIYRPLAIRRRDGGVCSGDLSLGRYLIIHTASGRDRRRLIARKQRSSRFCDATGQVQRAAPSASPVRPHNCRGRLQQTGLMNSGKHLCLFYESASGSGFHFVLLPTISFSALTFLALLIMQRGSAAESV